MPFILRTIRKNRWLQENLDWLKEGDVPADPLGDLATTNNELSVWFVEDDKSNLEQILAAFAATRETSAHVDYALFDPQILEELGILNKRTKGGTPDPQANTWHIDLYELSASKLVELTKALLLKSERTRISQKEICQLVVTAINLGRIDQASLKPDLAAKINNLISAQTPN